MLVCSVIWSRDERGASGSIGCPITDLPPIEDPGHMSASPLSSRTQFPREAHSAVIRLLMLRKLGQWKKWRWTLSAWGTGALGLLIAQLALWSYAEARDLTGAWVSDASTCKQVFKNSAGKLSFTKDADLYGSGFIYEKNKLVGKIATCTIKSHKEDGDVLRLITSCSTDVALATVLFNLRIEDDNQILRFFPGVSELDTLYYRCIPSQ